MSLDGFLVGSSPLMREVRERLRQLAEFDVPVWLRGESGTGKGVAARALHKASRRASGPLVTMSMTMFTPGLELDRFVGHAAGTFTDAKWDLPGAVEAAHGGTLLLDEFGDAAPATQGILLHVLEDRQVQRQGEHRPRSVDIRLVVATNRDLEPAVRAGTFRQDLYYRLPSLNVCLPPLRDHLEDIPELAAVLANRVVALYRCPGRALGPRQLDRLMAHRWPGNVRELDRAVEHWVISGRLSDDFGAELPAPGEQRRVQARTAVARRAGDKSAAARDLGVSRTTLYRWLDPGAAAS